MLEYRFLLVHDTVLFPDDLEAQFPPVIRGQDNVGSDAWKKALGGAIKFLPKPAMKFLQQVSTYYSHYHYVLTEGYEKSLYIVSTREREDLVNLLDKHSFMFTDNLLIYENGGDCINPHRTLAIFKEYTQLDFTPDDFVFIMKDNPSIAWQEAGIRQIVLIEGAKSCADSNIYIAGSLNDVLALTTSHAAVRRKFALRH